MVKALDAPYDPGARSAAWLKVKRSHTLDLVVLAAEWGHGRRRGWLSNLHLGAIDPASGEFVMLGKTFKGMTDAMLAWQTEELLKREVTRDEWTVRVRPELVVEVTFNDLQASPRYPGGLALRFARVKGYRPDKKAADADTMDTVRAIYAQGSSDSANLAAILGGRAASMICMFAGPNVSSCASAPASGLRFSTRRQLRSLPAAPAAAIPNQTRRL